MQFIDLPLHQLKEAPWNPNQMDEPMFQRLRHSLSHYGLVQNLVVRPVESEVYEVLSGNQRLQVLRESGLTPVPCMVVDLDDARARLLSQALNRIQGEDDLGLRAEALREILADLPQDQVLDLLPETTQSLQSLASLGQDDLAGYLQNWQQARGARLHRMQFQLDPDHVTLVEKALDRVMPQVRETPGNGPNHRGFALYLICQRYLEECHDER